MGEKELRKHRGCFTGHRPEKLTVSEERLAALLEAEIRKAIGQEFTTFITGMATMFSTWTTTPSPPCWTTGATSWRSTLYELRRTAVPPAAWTD